MRVYQNCTSNSVTPSLCIIHILYTNDATWKNIFSQVEGEIKNKRIMLTTDQQSMHLAKNNHNFIICGQAGTGKTYIITEVARQLELVSSVTDMYHWHGNTKFSFIFHTGDHTQLVWSRRWTTWYLFSIILYLWSYFKKLWYFQNMKWDVTSKKNWDEVLTAFKYFDCFYGCTYKSV